MTINNYNYQSIAKSHKRLQELAISDEVLVRVHPERFPLETLKKKTPYPMWGLYKVLRRFGSGVYELDIPYNLGINPVFSIKDLTRYRTFIRTQWFPVRPL